MRIGYQKAQIVAENCPLTASDLRAISHVRRLLIAGGYKPLAVHSPWSVACPDTARGKAPMGQGWQEGQAGWQLFNRSTEWARATSNTGLLLGVTAHPVQALDIDVNDVAAVRAIEDIIAAIAPASGLVRIRSNSARIAHVFRATTNARKLKIQAQHGAVERLAEGQQLVIHGFHSSGVSLGWRDGNAPWLNKAESLPLLSEDAVAAIFEAICTSGLMGAKLDRPSAHNSHVSRTRLRGGPWRSRGSTATEDFKLSLARTGHVVSAVRQVIRSTGERGTGRHDALVSLAGILVQRGWLFEAAAHLLTGEADRWFGDGTWRKEVELALQHAIARHSAPTRPIRNV